MNDIGITGAGYSGLTLALRLQQLGIDPVLYAEEDPATMAHGQLPNTVGRFPHTLAREAELGIVDRSGGADDAVRIEQSVGPPMGIGFSGTIARPMRATDFRLLLPQMFELYLHRGGRVVIAPDLTPERIEAVAQRHWLTVVTVGRRSSAALFPVDQARSPYRQPQRRVLAALLDGLALPGPAVSLNLAPGVGEVVQMPIRTRHGLGTNILINAVPGGPLSPLVALPPTDPCYGPALADALERFAPAVAARVDRAALAVTGERDWVRASIVPTVRWPWRVLPGGRLAVAIGDAWITNDPLTGQGANLGSHCAWVAADHIARQLDRGHAGGRHRGGVFDARFGRHLERDLWRYAGSVTALTNAFLQAPPPHVVQLLMAAATDQAVADRYVNLFDDPPAMWAALASSATVRALVAGVPVGSAPAAPAVPAPVATAPDRADGRQLGTGSGPGGSVRSR